VIPIWVVYDHPADWPGCFVARCWRGEEPTDAVMVAPDLDTLRGWLADFGLVKLDRHASDDPKIVETWL
jgi:hypothetical protein